MKIEITADEMITMIKYFQKPYMMGADKIKKRKYNSNTKCDSCHMDTTIQYFYNKR